METYRVYRACVDLMERNGCVRCWLQLHCCICASLPPLPLSLVAPHRLVLLLHHLEFARASNTGKLMLRAMSPASDGSTAPLTSVQPLAVGVHWVADEPLSAPLFASSPSFSSEGVMLLIAGIPSHDAALEQICSADRDGVRTFVLFPSVSASTVEQHMQRAQTAAAGKAAAETESTIAQTIIVVDGTFSQAAQLVRRIPPHIPRVKLAHCQQTESDYYRYVKAVKRRMAEREDEKEKDEEDEQSDVHRRGKQWSGADNRLVAKTASSPLAAPADPVSDSRAAVPSFLSSSFFTAIRKQPQGDRVSTVEAIAFCLYNIKLHSPPADSPPHCHTAAARVPFPSVVLDSLLLLVDALRLQAGLYQQYRTHSRQRRCAIKAARLLLYKHDSGEERERRRTEQAAVVEVEGGRLCRPFNKQLGCDKRQCKYSHRCGLCGGEHSLVHCPHGSALLTWPARSGGAVNASSEQQPH